jgi:hypothetical protein
MCVGLYSDAVYMQVLAACHTDHFGSYSLSTISVCTDRSVSVSVCLNHYTYQMYFKLVLKGHGLTSSCHYIAQIRARRAKVVRTISAQGIVHGRTLYVLALVSDGEGMCVCSGTEIRLGT